MAVDHTIFKQIKTKEDYDLMDQEFQLKKAIAQQKLLSSQSGSDLPAAIQLAKEYERRTAMGDQEGANRIAYFAKTWDKGITMRPDGSFEELPGYGTAAGGIAATKAGMAQQAKKNVDVVMDPLIALGEADARNTSDLNYSGPIKQRETEGKAAGEATGTLNKKKVQAVNSIDLANEASALLPQASSGMLEAGGAAVQGALGQSTEATRANARLKVLSAGLVSNVPRMEGPQSDADALLYREAAGNVGNPNIPYEDREAALSTIIKLQEKYADPIGMGGDPVDNTNPQQNMPAPKVNPSKIPMSAAKYLKQNPDLAADFDAKYGAGASRMVLGR